jgi:hypothetical protein
MPLRDLLKKKGGARHDEKEQQSFLDIPQDDSQFKFIRTTTNSQEEISPPAFPDDRRQQLPTLTPIIEKRQRGHSLFRRHSPSNAAEGEASKTLSDRLHLVSRSRSASSSSVNIPANLPEIDGAAVNNEDKQAEWEKRATLLAKGNALSRSASPLEAGRSPGVSDPQGDVWPARAEGSSGSMLTEHAGPYSSRNSVT